MGMRAVLACVAGLALGASVATADPAEVIGWTQLPDPAAQVFEDPYAGLEYDQVERLARIARLSARGAAGQGEADVLRAGLASEGLDADWLISQRWVVAEKREAAASAGNPVMDGRQVRLAGFAIPAPPDADGAGVVYLVPRPGLCSHMPPPNPNQMIRVRIDGDWRPSRLHEPVRLTGRLSIAPTRDVFRVVDGEVPMAATFLLEADEVESFTGLTGGKRTASQSASVGQ